jgi:hypothetical protein
MLSLKADLFPELKHDQPASKDQAEHRKHMKKSCRQIHLETVVFLVL